MPDITASIWNDMLTAEMNVRYFGYLTRHYSKIDRWLKIFIAITSSASVASWQLWNQSAGFIKLSWVWQALSAAAAIAAICLPIIDLGKQIRITSSLRSKWMSIENEYKTLWNQPENLSGAELDSRYSHIMKMEELLAEVETGIPYKSKLVLKAQDEVVTARGLTLPT